MSQISLKNLLRLIALRWRVVLVVSALLFASGAAYVFSLEPAYTAGAVVLLSPASDELGDQSAKNSTAMTDPIFIRSETAIMTSDGLSRSVIEKLKLWTVAEFLPRSSLKSYIRDLLRWSPKKVDANSLSPAEILHDHILHYYKDQLSVFNDGRSKAVEIEFTASNPRIAAAIANAHADAYLQQQLTSRYGTQQKTIEWLAREVDARANEVRDADAQVQQYQLRHGIVSTNDSTIVEQRLSQLSTQLVEARRQLSTRNALLSEVRKIRSGGDAGSAVNMLEDAPLKDLLQRRVTAEAAIMASVKRLAPTHPTLVKQRQELASIEGALIGQLARLESEARSGASWWQRQVNDLDAAVSSETTSKVDQDRLVAALPALMAQAQVKRMVFETVLNRYQTLLVEQSLASPAASIISRAVPSARPSFPNTSLLLVITAMASMLGGALAAILSQIRKPTSMGLTEVADAIDIRPLVAIPRFINASRIDGVVKIKDPRLFIESIRFLRDAVLDRQEKRQSTVCLVTSVLPRQGKSLVAMSLARAIARADRRTLFIEMDLRRPTASSLARRAPPVKGLAAVLERRASISEVVIRDGRTNLDMLLAEEHASTALDRLTTVALSELLAKLQGHYDAIVIDSPPVGLVSDALTLTSLVDQTIIVAKDGDSSVDELKRGIRLLKERGATVAGLVLTSVDPRGMSSVDKKTMHRYVLGVPAAIPIATKQDGASR